MSAKDQDHYAVLGVAPTATAEEIKRAYLARARQVHPDLQKTRLTLKTEWTKEVNEAYQVLKDPTRRARFDRERRARPSADPTPPRPSPESAAPRQQEPPRQEPPRQEPPQEPPGQERPPRPQRPRQKASRTRPSPTRPRPGRTAQPTRGRRFRLIVLTLAAGLGVIAGAIVMLLVLQSSREQQPRPTRCVFTLLSRPLGARVLKGTTALIGMTPVKFEHEAGVRLLLTFDKPGYERQQRVAVCHEGRNNVVKVALRAFAPPRPSRQPAASAANRTKALLAELRRLLGRLKSYPSLAREELKRNEQLGPAALQSLLARWRRNTYRSHELRSLSELRCIVREMKTKRPVAPKVRELWFKNSERIAKGPSVKPIDRQHLLRKGYLSLIKMNAPSYEKTLRTPPASCMAAAISAEEQLTPALRARVARASRLLSKRAYRKANLAAERLLRDLPRAQRWRAHQILVIGYCGLQELANVRTNFEHLPKTLRARTLRRCKRVGTDFVP